MPLVSIIIPVYNAEKHLEDAVNSVLNQTFTNLEIILVNDGSTDSSLQVAQSFTDPRIKVISKANSGASASRNAGLAQATGKYIQFFDADDILAENKIAKQITLLDGRDDLIALGNTIHFTDGTDPYQVALIREWYQADALFEPVDFLLKLYMGNEIEPGYGGMIQPNAWLTPISLIQQAGNWNEFKCPDDDGEFFCRVILASKGVIYTKDAVSYYRKYSTGQSWSSKNSRESVRNTLLAIDLKYSYLKGKADNKLLDRIFARHYWDLGVNSYPAFKDLSNQAIHKAKRFGYSGPKYTAGKLSTFLSKIFGWRIMRILSYFKYRH